MNPDKGREEQKAGGNVAPLRRKPIRSANTTARKKPGSGLLDWAQTNLATIIHTMQMSRELTRLK